MKEDVYMCLCCLASFPFSPVQVCVLYIADDDISFPKGFAGKRKKEKKVMDRVLQGVSPTVPFFDKQTFVHLLTFVRRKKKQ